MSSGAVKSGINAIIHISDMLWNLVLKTVITIHQQIY